MLLLSNNLEQEIKKLMAYFAVFDYPLTAWEIWQYLPVACNFLTIQQTLATVSGLKNKNGFYCLSETDYVIRQQRYTITNQKIKRLKPVIKIFSFLPWVKLICLANQVGSHNLRQQGDIDLLMVVEPRRLWITRLFCNSLLQVLGLRPTVCKLQNTICLSFWLSSDQLNLQPYWLRQAPDLSDRYFIYWLACLAPLYDQNQIHYQKLLEQNPWIKNCLPNWSGRAQEVKYRYFKTKYPPGYKELMCYLGNRLELPAKNLQLKILAPAIREQMNKDNRVVVNDSTLKLHTNDRRQYFFEKYLANLHPTP